MKFFREVVFPAGLLGSLIIGAGMFSLPYVFAQTGAVFGTILTAFFTLVAATIHTKYAEIVSINGTDKRFVALSEEHLGVRWRIPATAVVLGGIAITLSVYLALSPSFAKLMVPQITDSAAVFLFWIIGALLIGLGILKYAFIDFAIFIVIAGIIGFMAIAGYFSGRPTPIFPGSFSITAGLIAFGPLLFSLSGRSAISAIWENYKASGYPRKKFLSAMTLGTIIPAVLYLAFVYGIGKLSGSGVSPDAVSGITLLGDQARFLIGALGILALVTSYILLGLEFRGILERDFRMAKPLAISIPVFLPVIIYISGLKDFFKLVSLAGGFFLAAESILVVAMYRAATGRRSRFDVVLAIAFVIAIIFEVVIIRQ